MRLPGICQDCRRPLVWNGSRWTTPSGSIHACTVRCGVFMKAAQDRCGRRTGHNGPHRSQYAVDNERVARSGRAA